MQGQWHTSMIHYCLQPTLSQRWTGPEEVMLIHITYLIVVSLPAYMSRTKWKKKKERKKKIKKFQPLLASMMNLNLCLSLVKLPGILSTSCSRWCRERPKHSSFTALLALRLDCWRWLCLLFQQWHCMYHLHLNSSVQPSQSPEMKSDFSKWN